MFCGAKLFYGQQESARIKYPKQDLFFGVESQLGLNAIELFKKKSNNWEAPAPLEKAFFSYGFTASVGYHFIPRLSVETGLKYAYITDDIHAIYFKIHPKLYLNIDDEHPVYLGLYYGNKINQTSIQSAQVYGFDVGSLGSISKFSNCSPGFFIENYQLDANSNWFFGLKIGINLFTGNSYD